MCAPLWASVHTKALQLSFLVTASETRLRWSKALEYKTGATLIKVVMFNSIFVFSLLSFTCLSHWSQYLIFFFTMHIGLFHLRFHVYILSFPSLHLINCVCRVSCLYVLYSLLFSFPYIQLQFPFPIFFYCLLEFRPTFFSACQVQLPSIC